MRRELHVVLPSVLAVGSGLCIIWLLAIGRWSDFRWNDWDNALFLVPVVLCAVQVLYARRVAASGVMQAAVASTAQRVVKAVTTMLALTIGVGVLAALFLGSVNLGCRDCQGAAIVLVIPLLGVAILGVLAVLLQLVALWLLRDASLGTTGSER